MSNKQLISGSAVAVQAAIDAGARMMYGYPITPVNDVFSDWIKAGKPYLQTEDEIAAGFCVCGAALAGQAAFTATSGPGHVLLQDALSMAEGMRLPFVAIVGMRGGPSSGTVIYSQQEVTLACFGGNGEGLRLVYSPSNFSELYNLTIRAFQDAWKYRMPAIVLTDGYLLKTKGIFIEPEQTEAARAVGEPIIKAGGNAHLPSIYALEEELHTKLLADRGDFIKMSMGAALAEEYNIDGAEIIIIAHGIVGASAKQAVLELKKQGRSVGLFRPITLSPFPRARLNKFAAGVKRVAVVESSFGQLERIVRDNLDSTISVKIDSWHYPALGVEPDDIMQKICEIMD